MGKTFINVDSSLLSLYHNNGIKKLYKMRGIISLNKYFSERNSYVIR